MADISHLIKRFSELADDFFLNILFLKSIDYTNKTLPFLHAHSLEISLKTVCYKNNIEIQGLKNGHDVLGLLNLIKQYVPNISTSIPTAEDFINYKKIWVDGKVESANINIPPPAELDKLELAYFMDNVMNLKYGFTKDLIQLSQILIARRIVNESFLTIFRECRKVYANEKLNIRFKEKIFEFYGETEVSKIKIKELLDI